jgi:lipoic acid synthetase
VAQGARPGGETFHNLKKLARDLNLHTVCESAQCPNIGECWNQKSATFMMLGNLCTRRCGFCAVPKGKPEPIDFDEPRRVAYAVAQLGLAHAVITSVNRDDDNLGAARAFVSVIREIRSRLPPAASRSSRRTSRATNRCAWWSPRVPRS